MSERMEIISLNSKEIVSPLTTSIRQLIISPLSWSGDGTRLILACKAPQDISTATEEHIRLNMKEFPAIGTITKDGTISVDPYFCRREGLYNNLSELHADLKFLLTANGFL